MPTKLIVVRCLLALVLLLQAPMAVAYIGPGLGLGVIGVVLGMLVAIVLAIFAVLWYPLKRMFKKEAKSTTQEKPEKDEHDESVN